ncbi:D-alanyl-D-alanine endopeptidase (penicillin-binding protein 7) [Roseateles sp. YR242]|nr:D-alanyl-D-alanine endopeptidase (penicillin-binding protein 7) [Roseateles sp. YR242]
MRATADTADTAAVLQPAIDRSAPAFTNETLVRLPVNARHMMVVDDTGHVLMAKDADAVVPIASLTKLMTAMVVLDAHQAPEDELRIEDEDVDHLKHSASRVAVGARLTRAAALEMALMASENRAASVLARHYPGGLPAFESAMQAKIRALGLTHTTLNDPTGLSPENLSTAAEVARIAMAASRYPEITRITSGKSARVAVNGRPRELHNTNHLVGGKGWDIRLSKTGFTNEAGRCLAMRMKNGSQTLTVVLLDTDGSAQRLRDAALIRRSLAGEPRHIGRKLKLS